MKKTLADLKRALCFGAVITCVYNRYVGERKKSSLIGVKRYVVSVQSNAVELSPDPNAKSGSRLDFPRAAQLEYYDNEVKIYEVGERELTAHETDILNKRPSAQPENKEKCWIDAMTDGSQMYWEDMRYFRNSDCPYLAHVYKTVIKDNKLKGDLLLAYVIGEGDVNGEQPNSYE